MELVIVTGLSGAGKSRAVDALEDIGFYCVDNMPPQLMPKFAELCGQSEEKYPRIAIVTDVRGGAMFDDFFSGLDELRDAGYPYRILFLDCSDPVLISRYKETRRKHPLSEQVNLTLEQCVAREREMLKPVRARADFILDTTHLSPAQMKSYIVKLFLGDTSSGLMIQCMSFGFKYGSPTDADLVFDVRCLPNPFYVDELRGKTGLDEPVREYVMKWPQTEEFLHKLLDFIDYLLPLYCNEGKSSLVIAVGCTGGKHRSVTIAEQIYSHLQKASMRVSVNHRDISKI